MLATTGFGQNYRSPTVMYSELTAKKIASRFCIDEPIFVEDFQGKGNINLDTVLVVAGDDRTRYLMQRINEQVFPMPDRVMKGMLAILKSQQDSLTNNPHLHTHWRPITLVPTHTGDPYHIEENSNGVWRMMHFVEHTKNFKSLNAAPVANRLKLAEEVGRGLAVYTDLTARADASTISASLPGYRNTEIYYAQFRAAIHGNREVDHALHPADVDDDERTSTHPHYILNSALTEEEFTRRLADDDVKRAIDVILEAESHVMRIRKEFCAARIRKTLIHGDTKIENFLFDQDSLRAVSLVDLDTIMPLTWLADWGDLLRSLSNVAGELEENLSNVVVDRDIYNAVARGFLASTSVVDQHEVELMTVAVETLALETGMRFLADYLRGETYFKLKPTDPPYLNRTRALVQLKLYKELRALEPELTRIIELAWRNQ